MDNAKFKIVLWTMRVVGLTIAGIIAGVRMGVTMGLVLFGLGMLLMPIIDWFGNKPDGYIRANPWITSAGIAAGLFILVFVYWILPGGGSVSGWISMLLLIAAIAFWVKHMCLRKKWCSHTGTWWTTKSWPATKAGWKKAWKLFEGCIGWLSNWSKQTVAPWIIAFATSKKPWLKANWLLLASIGFGWWAYSVYGNKRETSMFWMMSLLSFGFLLAHSETARLVLRKVLGVVFGSMWEKYKELFERFQKKTSDNGRKLAWFVFACVNLSLCFGYYDWISLRFLNFSLTKHWLLSTVPGLGMIIGFEVFAFTFVIAFWPTAAPKGNKPTVTGAHP